MGFIERGGMDRPPEEGSVCQCGGTFRRGENGHLFCDVCGREVALERREIFVFRCLRCGYEWMPRKRVGTDGFPKRCASCRSADWNKPYAYHKVGKPMPGRERKPRVLAGKDGEVQPA